MGKGDEKMKFKSGKGENKERDRVGIEFVLLQGWGGVKGMMKINKGVKRWRGKGKN